VEFIEPVTTGVLVPPRTGTPTSERAGTAVSGTGVLTTQAGDLEEDLVDRPKTPFRETSEDFEGASPDCDFGLIVAERVHGWAW